ncbi:MAG: hypothetical protein H8E21_01015 [Gammaproteobacteria bacterium]|nr:hypothetical protein [Gammaproteobacteria bacterium]MBL7000768.1 hypothetical protein [Gammaproteobacteria bacterium]
MKNSFLYLLKGLTWLLPIFLFACSSQPQTSFQQASAEGDSGFGGTGIIRYSTGKDEGSSGFGGTGIVGNIDAFGSIWVNGIEIDYDQNVLLSSNLAGSDSQLKLGQTVILETVAESNDNNRPYTREIRILYAMAGKIQAFESKRIKMHDQWIQLPETVYRDEGLILQNNQFIAINAYQDDNAQWVASRLNTNLSSSVIKPASIEVDFSDRVKQIIINERFKFIRPDWPIKRIKSPMIEKQFIPAQQWKRSLSHRPEKPAERQENPEIRQLIQDRHHYRPREQQLPPPRPRR